MGRGRQPLFSACSGRRRADQSRVNALVAAVGGRMPSAGAVVELDDLYRALATKEALSEPALSLRLVDALWHRELDEFASQAMRLRLELQRLGMNHDARRMMAGLSIHAAERAIARVHAVTVTEILARTREGAELAKRAGIFPWHLLDG